MTPVEQLFIRGAVSSIFFMGLLNVRAKHFLYTSIDPKLYKALAMRVIISAVFLGFLYYALKYLPLVFISLVINTAPFLTAVLSYLLLRVKISFVDCMILVVSFGGVAVMVTGTISKEDEQKKEVSEQVNLIFPIIACLLFPFGIAV